ncbi:MAG: flagellar hook assembly protein FlgD [Syntrophobacterales bacterium]|jgi:flagellar basal-body rod modification protein FlgD|nr:flagellar hook assembly protein FlgD [Syntrophobacterales bacterium]
MAIIDNTLSGVTSQQGTGQENSTTKSLGKDDFLRMLVAQLQNQDPLSPMDGTDFVAQLATFSSLEQLTNMNSQLGQLGVYQATLTNTQAVNLLGKEVTVNQDNGFQVSGSTADFSYNLTRPAESVSIVIYDSTGKEVDRIEADKQDSGLQTMTWAAGSNANGLYSYNVLAYDANGNRIPAETMMTGKVTAVQYRDNAIYLTINDREVTFNQVVAVKGG